MSTIAIFWAFAENVKTRAAAAARRMRFIIFR
jgi:hypothetical protein